MTEVGGPRGSPLCWLDDLEQQKDENDEEYEADGATSVVTEPWAQAISSKAKYQDQDNQQDEHIYFLLCFLCEPVFRCR